MTHTFIRVPGGAWEVDGDERLDLGRCLELVVADAGVEFTGLRLLEGVDDDAAGVVPRSWMSSCQFDEPVARWVSSREL